MGVVEFWSENGFFLDFGNGDDVGDEGVDNYCCCFCDGDCQIWRPRISPTSPRPYRPSDPGVPGGT